MVDKPARSGPRAASEGEFSALDPIIDQSPFGMAVIDGDGIYRTVNASYCAIYGYREDEMLGRSFTMVFAPADRPVILAAHRHFIDHGGTLSGERSVVRRDGSGLVVIMESARIRAPDGRYRRLIYVVDITARKQMERELRHSEITFRALFETIPLGVVYHDLDGRIKSANPAALQILGLSLEQMLGKTPMDPLWRTVHEDGSPFTGHDHPAAEALRTGEIVRDVIMGIQIPARAEVWIRINAVPVYRDGRLHEVYSSFTDITESVRLSQELHRQARTDHLTGAANRRAFMEELEREFARIRRYPAVRSCLLIVDLDHFKRVNDTFGHAVGDAVLRHVTGIMLGETRRQDTLGRYGGEEFALLLPETTGPEAVALASRLRQRVEISPMQHQQTTISTTVSIGVSLILPTDAMPDAALLRADDALYRAKRDGRNRVEVIES